MTQRKRETFSEPAPTNTGDAPCELCAAKPGMPHGRGCAYAAEWVEAERVFNAEHDA